MTPSPKDFPIWIISSTPPHAHEWREATDADGEDGGVYGVVYRMADALPSDPLLWVAHTVDVVGWVGSLEQAKELVEKQYERMSAKLRLELSRHRYRAAK